MPELLLEIGFEEMPASWLEGLGGQLSQKLTEAAAREFLDPKDVLVQWTPRRLVARASVVARQADRVLVLKDGRIERADANRE